MGRGFVDKNDLNYSDYWRLKTVRRTFGLDKTNRHTQMICFSPNEKLEPASTTSAFNPPIRSSQLDSPALFNIAWISSSLMFSLFMRRFSLIVPENKKGVCVIMPNRKRAAFGSNLHRSIVESMYIFPVSIG